MNIRSSNIERLNGRTFDVLIVGGGINGAVSASALTSQGAKVALIDRGDFGSYTSQQSSNLVWGGIKYLESAELALVRKLCVSRNRLIRTYPSSVKEIRFMANVERGFRVPRLLLFLGACLYWLVGNLFTRPPRLLAKRDIDRDEPHIRTEDGTGGIEFSDAYLVDNDTRFVFNFIRAALDHGGIMANYVEAIGSERDGSGYWHTRARDVVSGREISIRSRVVVNACGPFADEMNRTNSQETNHHHLFSKGVHLIVDRVTEVRRVLTFFADDGRLFFVIPLGTKSCIGTTDTRVKSLPPVVTDDDRDFILDNVNKRLNLTRPLTRDDIIAERCGVRPLVVSKRGQGYADEGDWTSLSRKHAIESDATNRHISIFGGKLTDCLNVGEEVSQAVLKMGVKLPYQGVRWYGEPPDEVRDEFFHQATLMNLDAMTAPESSEPLSTRLWRRYASSALSLLEDIRQDPRMADVLIHGTEYIRCEIHHAARREMIVKLEDFLRRRSKIALVERTAAIQSAPGLMEACRILFGDQAQARFDEYFDIRGQQPPSHSASA
ncbi:MAG: glycerol-3-phosphate dehydrogenase/oxidase [Myxococcales bacterium]|nr:glycerol-3-phosphate dehydrogenase/oxidase [Myxococcales bacterium]MDD9964993.1 glycerol-3-phosphate dehydrogenase/oxidase [Myxococcales bacterium]